MDILKVKVGNEWVNIPAIMGQRGVGIQSIVKVGTQGAIDTYTIVYEDGTTSSFTVTNGITPQFSIGEVQDGAVAAATITGTAENPVLNLTLPNANVPTRVSELENDAGYLSDVQVDGTSIVDNGIANVPIASDGNAGVIKAATASSSYNGVFVNSSNVLRISPATTENIKTPYSRDYKPIVPSQQHSAAFYGLAKAAGDTTQSQSANAVGTYTNEAKAAIQTMLDVPSNADVAAKQDTLTFDSAPTANSINPVTSGGVYNAIANINTMKIHICAQGEYNSETGVPTIQNPDTQTFYLVPGGEGSNLFIEWAYVNSAWERFDSADVDLSNYVQRTDYATANDAGVVKVSNTGASGLAMQNGELKLFLAQGAEIKSGANNFKPIVPSKQHESTFYGLAKAAGDSTQSASDNAVGIYTDEAKAAIQQMLGVSDLIATPENNLTASKAYTIGDVFTANGKLYKATAAIAADAAIITDGAGANCEKTSVGEGFPHDVQVNGISIIANGVANIPIGDGSTFGVFKTLSDRGTAVTNGKLEIVAASDSQIKNANSSYRSAATTKQHAATFYGLAKAAGDTTQSASNNNVGQYTDSAKASIKAMLGIQDGSTGTVDVSGTTPTITAVENTRYVCGEVTSLDFTPAASGICIVRFTSGSTVTVLTLPNTVKFPEWFDPTSLETNTIYEICITDGVYGAVMSWAQ